MNSETTDKQADAQSVASTTFSQMLLFHPGQKHAPRLPAHLYKKSALDYYQGKDHDVQSTATVPPTSCSNTRYEQLHRQYAASKQAYLKQLLTATTPEQKDELKQIQSCVKLLYKRARVDARKLKKLYLLFVRDFYQLTGRIQQSISLEQFEETFSKSIKMPNADVERICQEKLREILVCPDAPEQQMVSLKKFKVVVDLYQFLPPVLSVDESSSPVGIEEEESAETPAASKAGSVRESKSAHSSFRVARLKTPSNRSDALSELMSTKSAQMPQSTQPQTVIKRLFEHCRAKVGSVSNIFKLFDRQHRKEVSYSDFTFTIQQDLPQLGDLDRQTLLQVFSFMDRDHDGLLKHPDFLQAAQQVKAGVFSQRYSIASPTPASTTGASVQVDDINERFRQSERFAKAVTSQNFVSSDLDKYIGRFTTINNRVSAHRPQHNQVERTTGSSHDDRRFTTLSECRFTSRNKQEQSDRASSQCVRTFGLSSNRLHTLADPFAPVNGGRIASVLNNAYAEDRLIEMRMQDALRQESKLKQTQENFRKTTTTQQLRQLDTKRKLKLIEQKEAFLNATTPQLCHSPGAVTQFYPNRDIQAMVNKFRISNETPGQIGDQK